MQATSSHAASRSRASSVCAAARPPLSKQRAPRTLAPAHQPAHTQAWAPCRAQNEGAANVAVEGSRRQPDGAVPGAPLEDRVRLRSEAEAPWRAVRLVFSGFFIVSASVGFLVSVPQLIGALGHAPNALPLSEVLTNLAVDAGAAGFFTWALLGDLKARDKQMARLGREESLSECQVQLANGKKLRLAQLRGAVRVVVCAGTHAQVREALASAEPYKAELQRRGVLVVTLPIYEPEASGADAVAGPAAEDLRWRASATGLDQWKSWFAQQLSMSSKANSERGLYVSLRKDGRVRGSGMGQPPWAQLAAQLPPEEGMWSGLLDGMDGKI